MSAKKKKSEEGPELSKDSEAEGVDIQGRDFEEILLEFWNRNRRVIEVAAGLLLVAVVCYQVMIYVGERRKAALQRVYQEASEGEERISFAEANSGNPLSGVAYLEEAHREYDEREFLAAAEHYRLAIEALVDTPLEGRARFGFAMARIQSGYGDEGGSTLLEIANNLHELDTTRAEAAYHLAVLHWEREEFSEMKDQLQLIGELEFPGLRKPSYWSSKADELMNSLPGLRELAE